MRAVRYRQHLYPGQKQASNRPLLGEKLQKKLHQFCGKGHPVFRDDADVLQLHTGGAEPAALPHLGEQRGDPVDDQGVVGDLPELQVGLASLTGADRRLGVGVRLVLPAEQIVAALRRQTVEVRVSDGMFAAWAGDGGNFRRRGDHAPDQPAPMQGHEMIRRRVRTDVGVDEAAKPPVGSKLQPSEQAERGNLAGLGGGERERGQEKRRYLLNRTALPRE